MFKKILIPVDGSSFSEAVLPHAQTLAKKYDATVHLLRVQSPDPYEPPWGAAVTAIPEPLQVRPADQLELLAQRLKIEGVSTSIEVAEGHTAEAILDCAKHSHADLIAMTTHGRSGLSRWWLGSVADKVVRASHIPVLLVRPEEPA